jgi:hypothetical protein
MSWFAGSQDAVQRRLTVNQQKFSPTRERLPLVPTLFSRIDHPAQAGGTNWCELEVVEFKNF